MSSSDQSEKTRGRFIIEEISEKESEKETYFRVRSKRRTSSVILSTKKFIDRILNERNRANFKCFVLNQKKNHMINFKKLIEKSCLDNMEKEQSFRENKTSEDVFIKLLNSSNQFENSFKFGEELNNVIRFYTSEKQKKESYDYKNIKINTIDIDTNNDISKDIIKLNNASIRKKKGLYSETRLKHLMIKKFSEDSNKSMSNRNTIKCNNKISLFEKEDNLLNSEKTKNKSQRSRGYTLFEMKTDLYVKEFDKINKEKCSLFKEKPKVLPQKVIEFTILPSPRICKQCIERRNIECIEK